MEKYSDVIVLPKKVALNNFKDLMLFQYGNKKESEAAWKRLQKERK